MSRASWASGPGADVYRLVMENEPEPGYFQSNGTPCLDPTWVAGVPASAQPCQHRYWAVGGQPVEIPAEALIVVSDSSQYASAIVTFETNPPVTTAFRIDRTNLEPREDALGQELRNYWVSALLSDDGDPGERDLEQISNSFGELRGLYEYELRAAATQAAGVPPGLFPLLKNATVTSVQIDSSSYARASVAKLKLTFRFAEPTGGLTATTLNQSPTAAAIAQSVPGNQPTVFTAQGSDPDGSGLTYSIAWPPAHGTASVSGGSITYTPDYCHAGTAPDPFVYRVADSAGYATCATVTPTLTFPDDCDRDGVVDTADNCPNHFNPGQENWGTDTEGDACDVDDVVLSYDVDPRRTYLRRRNDNVNDATMMPVLGLGIINLAEAGIVPGTRVRLTRLGDFNFGGQPTETGTALMGVFSSTATILTDATVIDRLPNGIYAGLGFVTPNTYFPLDANGNSVGVPTDIPEDFLIGQVVLTVPAGAQFLILSALDTHFSGNSDPNNDFGVRIEVPR